MRGIWTRRTWCLAIGALAVPLSVWTPATANADSCSDQTAAPLPLDTGVCADVLLQEAQWLNAISSGDRPAVEAILGPNFTHINSDGQVLNRTQELAGIVDVPFTMNPSEQQVTIIGNTAVVHGLNTVIGGDGTTLARERFTDVFVLHDGRWLALSAQETSLDGSHGA